MSKRVQKLPEFKEKFDADTEALSLSWKDELIVIVLLLPIPINFLSVFLGLFCRSSESIIKGL